jgi:Bacterial SH3 domain
MCVMSLDRRATLKTGSLADRAAGIVSHGDEVASNVGSDAKAYSEGGDGSTPFYDLLTSMIQAHALENARVRQHDNAIGHDDMIPARNPVAEAAQAMGQMHATQWRTFAGSKVYRDACIAGLIVTVAMGGVIFLAQVKARQPLVVAAAYDPSKGRAPVIGAAGSVSEPVERPLQAGEPSGLEKPGVERNRTANVVAAALADDRAVAPPVPAQRIENLASDVQNPWQVEGALEVRWSSEATHSDTIALTTSALSNDPLPQVAASSPPPAGKTGSTVDRTNAIRIARAIMHVNMRAGPSNDQAVVMRIPEGSPLEVVHCHQWCEVIFAGRRGWVYQGFIGP